MIKWQMQCDSGGRRRNANDELAAINANANAINANAANAAMSAMLCGK